jgi:hypothetical protein
MVLGERGIDSRDFTPTAVRTALARRSPLKVPSWFLSVHRQLKALRSTVTATKVGQATCTPDKADDTCGDIHSAPK